MFDFFIQFSESSNLNMLIMYFSLTSCFMISSYFVPYAHTRPDGWTPQEQRRWKCTLFHIYTFISYWFLFMISFILISPVKVLLSHIAFSVPQNCLNNLLSGCFVSFLTAQTSGHDLPLFEPSDQQNFFLSAEVTGVQSVNVSLCIFFG